jgi:hypothetical protein
MPDYPSIEYRKKWSRSSIKPEDYDFTCFAGASSNLLFRIYHWEIDRELGSRQTAFQLSRKCRSDAQFRHIRHNQQIIEPIQRLGNNELGKGFSDHITPMFLKVDWSASDDQLGESFKRLLKCSPRPVPRRSQLRKPKQYHVRLNQLVAYRLREARISFFDEVPDGYPYPVELNPKGRQGRKLVVDRGQTIPQYLRTLRLKGKSNVERRWEELNDAAQIHSSYFDHSDSPNFYLTRDPSVRPF